MYYLQIRDRTQSHFTKQFFCIRSLDNVWKRPVSLFWLTYIIFLQIRDRSLLVIWTMSERDRSLLVVFLFVLLVYFGNVRKRPVSLGSFLFVPLAYLDNVRKRPVSLGIFFYSFPWYILPMFGRARSLFFSPHAYFYCKSETGLSW